MSVKNTYTIDRQTAIDIIESKINSCSNKELANILEAIRDNECANYQVYYELPNEEDVREFEERFMIRTVNAFERI